MSSLSFRSLFVALMLLISFVAFGFSPSGKSDIAEARITCVSNCPNAQPSLYPAAVFAATPTPLATNFAGAYALPTPVSVATTGPGGYAPMLIGVKVNSTCVIQEAVQDANTSGATPVPTTAPALYTPLGYSVVCMYGPPSNTPNLSFAPNSSGAIRSVPVAWTHLNVNGQISVPTNGTVEYGEYLIPRDGSTTVTATANGNGHNYVFTIADPTLSNAQAAAELPVRGAGTTFGVLLAAEPAVPPTGPYAGTYNEPVPYPIATALHFGPTGYCDEVAANSFSISSGLPLDLNRITHAVQLGATWARNPLYPFGQDLTHRTPAGQGYDFSTLDSLMCGEIRNGIIPRVDMEYGSLIYGTTTVATYQTPADFQTFATAIANHVKAVFPEITEFACPANEPNDTTSPLPSPWNNIAGIIVYSKACYQGIKSVNSNYIVAWGNLNADPSSTAYTPAQMIQAFYGNGCRLGLCADLLDFHFTFCGDPLGTYDPITTDNGFQGGYCENANSIPYYQDMAAKLGETYPVYFDLGETMYYGAVPNTFYLTGSPQEQLNADARILRYYTQNPYIHKVDISNLDADCAFGGTIFSNQAVIASPTCGPSPTYTARPALAAIQQFTLAGTGNTPVAPPTLAPGTAPGMAVAFAQNPVMNVAVGSLSFATVPYLGSTVVAIQEYRNGLPGGVTDSLTNVLTNRVNIGGGGGEVYDYSAPLGVGTTYTFANGSQTFSAIYNLTNVSGTPLYTGLNGSTTSLVMPITGVHAGDALTCTASAVAATVTGITISNSTGIIIDFNDANSISAHAIATTTATSTCTISQSAATGINGVFIDYP